METTSSPQEGLWKQVFFFVCRYESIGPTKLQFLRQIVAPVSEATRVEEEILSPTKPEIELGRLSRVTNANFSTFNCFHGIFLLFSDLLRNKTEQLEKELAECQKKLEEKQEELAARDERVKDLELRIKAQDKGYKDKMARLSQLVAKYKRQAEESAAKAAELVFQSHKQNMLRTRTEHEATAGATDVERPSSAGALARSRSSPRIKPALLQPHAPTEPKEARPQSCGKHRHRALPRGAMTATEPPQGHSGAVRDIELVKVRGSSLGRKLSAQEDVVVPDPEPFLQLSRAQQQQQQQKLALPVETRREPLPPITTSAVRSNFKCAKHSARNDRASVPVPSKSDSANFKKLKERTAGKGSSSLVTEVETLALKDITKKSVSSLRKAQEYGSD